MMCDLVKYRAFDQTLQSGIVAGMSSNRSLEDGYLVWSDESVSGRSSCPWYAFVQPQQ